MSRVEQFWAELTPEQRADVERFAAFWDATPQDAADFTPEEWARAEQLREAVGEILDVGIPVRRWAEWIRACELYDSVSEGLGS